MKKTIKGLTDEFVHEANRTLEVNKVDCTDKVQMEMGILQWTRLKCLMENLLHEAQEKEQEADETLKVITELHNAVTDPRKTFPTPSFEG